MAKVVETKAFFGSNADDVVHEKKEQVLSKRKALDDILEKECIGKYKIEIMFSHNRSVLKPTAGILHVWESGSKLHGGGDAKVYFCPGRQTGRNDCASVIPSDNSNYGKCLCPGCGVVWNADDVIGEILGVHTVQQWAQLITQYFHKLGSNADIYLKHPRMDVRKVAEMEQAKQLMGDKLAVSRSTVKKSIYPLARIIADTKDGADVYGRFYAFLKS